MHTCFTFKPSISFGLSARYKLFRYPVFHNLYVPGIQVMSESSGEILGFLALLASTFLGSEEGDLVDLVGLEVCQVQARNKSSEGLRSLPTPDL